MHNREYEMKEGVKNLWKLCFSDTDAFIDMYFQLRYSANVNRAVKYEGKVISALQMIPYPMTFCGKTVQTSYISGACTHPDFRGSGIMRELLSQALNEMKDNHIVFSTLIPAEPWLFDYYARMGYVPVFKYATRELCTWEAAGSEEVTISLLSTYEEEVYRYVDSKLSKRPNCIQHTEEDFKVVTSGLALSEGVLYVAKRDGQVDGVAIVYKEDKQILINELFANNKETECSLLDFIKQHSDHKQMVQLQPVDNTSPACALHTLGMARIIDAEEVLQRYAAAFPYNEMLIKVKDEQLPDNDGYYCLHKGECIHSTNYFPGSCVPMSISELANRILTPLHPYMSLMMN